MFCGFEVISGPSFKVSTKRTFSAIADHSSEEANEISLTEGDLLELVQTGDEGWWFMKNLTTGREGWTPSSYLLERSIDSGTHIEGIKEVLFVMFSLVVVMLSILFFFCQLQWL